LPAQILVDVSALEIGKSIHLGEIKAPEGVEIIGDKHLSAISVAAPRAEEEVAAAAPVAGEVEMTKEKKEEGAEGAAKTAAPAKDAKAPAGDAKAAAPAKDAKAEKKK
jgi:large subunit ribosomal protein L25